MVERSRSVSDLSAQLHGQRTETQYRRFKWYHIPSGLSEGILAWMLSGCLRCTSHQTMTMDMISAITGQSCRSSEQWRILTACFQMHKRGIRLVIPLLSIILQMNNKWFVGEPQIERQSYRDYYIGVMQKEGKEPNNWDKLLRFCVEIRSADRWSYYHHLFSTKQPDLNWENPAVRKRSFRYDELVV